MVAPRHRATPIAAHIVRLYREKARPRPDGKIPEVRDIEIANEIGVSLSTVEYVLDEMLASEFPEA
jgi:hypothetical protein